MELFGLTFVLFDILHSRSRDGEKLGKAQSILPSLGGSPNSTTRHPSSVAALLQCVVKMSHVKTHIPNVLNAVHLPMT